MITIRSAEPADAGVIRSFVDSSDALDSNSPYLYILLCTFFRDTVLIAEDAGEIVGFITGFVKPSDSDELFVWQMYVAPSHRNRHLATTLLSTLVDGKEKVKFIEATVDPDNDASNMTFRRLAEIYGCAVSFEPFLDPADFGNDSGANHPPEYRVRLGPLDNC